MKNRWKSALLSGILAVSGVVGPVQVASAASYAAGTVYEHYNAAGWRQGLFTGGACDQYGWDFNLNKMYVDGGFANWAHIASSIYLTGNGGCNSVRVYQRTRPSVYWTCILCGGKIINLEAPFNDDVGIVRVFRTTSIVP